MKKPRSRKTLTEANLELLGAARLASILMTVSESQPGVKRWLRMELAGEVGAEDLAAEIAKRLTAVDEARARVHWRKHKDFVRDLETLRLMISVRLAALDAGAAVLLAVRFVGLADGVFDRVKDAKGDVEAVFDAAVEDLAGIAPGSKPNARELGDVLFDIVVTGRTDLVKALVAGAAPALDADGLVLLRGRIETQMASRKRVNSALRSAVQVLADAQGDVDGYIATFSSSELVLPPIGARVARRLLTAGRVEEAMSALEKSAPESFGAKGQAPSWGPAAAEWEEVFIDGLEARGQGDLAQEARWTAFETRLSSDRLREFVRRLADFDDVVAEDRAMAHARRFRDFDAALRFFLQWPAADQMAALVLERFAEIAGEDLDLLDASARMLEARHPLAATLLLRASVLDIVRQAKVERYKDAQRQILECASLAVQIGDFGGHETHEAFLAHVARYRRW